MGVQVTKTETVGDYDFNCFKIVKIIVGNSDFRHKIRFMVGDCSFDNLLND